MKIAYVTTYDARNIGNWSGLGYFIAQSLSNDSLSVEHIGPLEKRYSFFLAKKEYAYKRYLNQRYLQDREPILLKYYAKQVSKQLPGLHADVVFSPGSIPIACLECKEPIAFWTDCTFANMIEFYPQFSNLCKESLRNGHKMESAALERANLVVYASNWAAESARTHYDVDPRKVKVVPFGANIECNRNLDDIRTIVDSRPSDVCKLLFLGVEWFRKGGDIAVGIAKGLYESGVNVELTLVGSSPRLDEPLPHFVRTLGFISKGTNEGLEILNKLLTDSHFLLLPSRAECFGVVLCEANSFGVPCLSTNVGGIPMIIKDDVNGKMFSKEAAIAEYCTYIEDLFANYARYRQLALSAFAEYKSRLNWSVAGQAVRKLLEGVIA